LEFYPVSSFVAFVPTHPQHVDAFFELAPVSASDVVYDLGSGDGRLVFAALERGAGMAVGIELDHDIVRRTRAEGRKKGLQDRASFIQGDVLAVDLSEATVVFCYLTPQASAALKPKFERELRPGTRVVMESFPIPGWTPAQTAVRGYADYYETNEFYLYVPRGTVPGEGG
jgi:16S rRNA G966 N2-methylase RsmD